MLRRYCSPEERCRRDEILKERVRCSRSRVVPLDKTGSCAVNIDGATITIVDSGGVGDHIAWEVHAEDGSGNGVTLQCEIVVANPGHP